MTQHVRDSYRDHRKATWGLALAVVALIAAVVIPFATGARPATYTFTGSASVCAGATQKTFSVTVTNTTTSSQNLGSADLYAPSNIRVTGANITAGVGTVKPLATVTQGGETRTLIPLRNVSLPGGQTPRAALTLTITADSFVAASPQPRSWFSIAKQSNDFNPGDLDLSNAFTLSGLNPTFEVATCRLEFVTQPPNPWEKNTTAGSPVEVAAFAGATRVTLSGTPSLTVASGSAGSTADFFFGAGTFDTGTTSWKWPSAKPNATAPGGLYNLVATLGSMTDTSDSNATTAGDQPFRVTSAVCASGDTCTETSDLPGAQVQIGITNTLPGSITIDFSNGDEARCSPWNRAFYTDSGGNDVYFPGVSLEYTWGDDMLKLVYRIRNAEWTRTNVSRGNNDIEICAGARHGVDLQKNGDGGSNPTPFQGKYGSAAWVDGLYWGVLATVSNAAKVRDDPAVCARGTQDLPTGPGGSSETWRTWTICIPDDWDWKNFG